MARRIIYQVPRICHVRVTRRSRLLERDPRDFAGCARSTTARRVSTEAMGWITRKGTWDRGSRGIHYMALDASRSSRAFHQWQIVFFCHVFTVGFYWPFGVCTGTPASQRGQLRNMIWKSRMQPKDPPKKTKYKGSRNCVVSSNINNSSSSC